MAQIMAHRSSPLSTSVRDFDIYDEGGSQTGNELSQISAASRHEVLGELNEAHSQNRPIPSIESPSPLSVHASGKTPHLEAKSHTLSRRIRAQRPKVDLDTFEPLLAVPEESSSILETQEAAVAPYASPDEAQVTPTKDMDVLPVRSVVPKSALQTQVERHLAGQFGWIMTYPAAATLDATSGAGDAPNPDAAVQTRLYGCNLLSVTRRTGSSPSAEPSTDVFTLIATELSEELSNVPLSANGLLTVKSLAVDQTHRAPPPPYPGVPVQPPDITTMVEQAMSSSLTEADSRSNFGDCAPRAGLNSVPRIEDSLEELDKLEEALEAVEKVTGTGPLMPDVEKPCRDVFMTGNGAEMSAVKASKGTSMASYAATVRAKPSKMEPLPLRGSASLSLRDKRMSQQGLLDSQSPGTNASQSQATLDRLSTPKHSIKSMKPLTIPKFELPGDAVARRLREQREARQAQQMEMQKAQTPSLRPRANKVLAKPTFELPGEAISRRKREESEAKLRVEEEELRRRREFKARSVMQGIGSASFPRRARIVGDSRAESCPAADCKPAVSLRDKTASNLRDDAVTASKPNSPQYLRVRDSAGTPTGASRPTSSSLGRATGKRNSISLEELLAQRQQGRDASKRDNVVREDKDKEKRARELTAKKARDEAAERSRMASREWAEKRRQAELAARQGMEK